MFFSVEINSIDMYIHYYICCVLFILVQINRSNVYAEIKYVQACDCIM